MPEFELLCDELHLTKEPEEAEQLERLKNWWKNTVSTDVKFKGSSLEEYTQYYNAAKQYCDVFLAKKFAPMSPTQYAAFNGYDRYLSGLNETAEIFSQPGNDGMTPLHWAAYKGHLHTVETLLEKGANPEKLNNEEQMPIYSTLLVPIKTNDRLYSRKQAIFELLFNKYPESIYHPDKSGDTVLHLMASDDHFSELLKKQLELNPSSLSQPNNLKHYPIHTAILNNQIENVRLLLTSKMGIEIQPDREKRVALHYAAKYGSDDMIRLCIANTSDLNVRDTYNKTPLILAAEAGKQTSIEALLHHHAKAELMDCDHKTYLDHQQHKQRNNF